MPAPDDRDRTCLLIAPFAPPGTEVSQRARTLFKYIVAPAADSTGFSVVRPDMIRPPAITADLVRLLVTADVVIADLTGLNPNILYEIGLRHAIGKPIVHIAEVGQFLPFDISNVRVLVVDTSDLASVQEAQAALVRILKRLDDEPPYQSSAVAAALDLELLEKARAKQIANEPLAGAAAVANALKAIETRIASARAIWQLAVNRKTRLIRDIRDVYSSFMGTMSR